MSLLNRAVARLDSMIGRGVFRLSAECPKLVIQTYHATAPAPSACLQPEFHLPPSAVAASIAAYLRRGYTPVSVAQVLKGLAPERSYFLATFDDGYANNRLMLPILQELKTPGLFAITTGAVASGEAFWWDVLSRNMLRRGATSDQVRIESKRLQSSAPQTIREELIERFGEDSLRPIGEFDRPLTRRELRQLAGHPLVTIANHTTSHPSLPHQTAEEVEAEILGAQRDLEDWTGLRPTTLAAPFGTMSEAAERTCEKAGLLAAFTLGPKRQFLPLDLDGAGRWRLERSCIRSDAPIEQQCERSTLDWSPALALRSLARRGRTALRTGFGRPRILPAPQAGAIMEIT